MSKIEFYSNSNIFLYPEEKLHLAGFRGGSLVATYIQYLSGSHLLL